MKQDQGFDLETLTAAYDRGCLVPFIGSGMSIPICANWKLFVDALVRRANVENQPAGGSETQRALSALQRLRQEGHNIRDAVRDAVYAGHDLMLPTHSDALASLFWPLVCSTNYDEVYLGAVLRRGRTVRHVLGRSESDCRHVLKHMALPDGEVLWALQGFLGPSQTIRESLGKEFDASALESELVVGHAEYRRVSHKALHFRRAFAELYRTRSLLFLGSGLQEPYFRALFDEIIELSGPPLRPHFAIVEKGTLDPEFMRDQYHILCRSYEPNRHEEVTQFLEALATFIDGKRVRPGAWRFQIQSSSRVEKGAHVPDFTVVRAALPDLDEVASTDCMGVSCGRNKSADRVSARGIPLFGQSASILLRQIGSESYEWCKDNDWVIRLGGHSRCYGIVARDLANRGGSSRDRRSPEAIRRAFSEFLDVAARSGATLAHVQLLASGRSRVFQPWIALVQMARAYGEWVRKGGQLSVVVYVVDPGVIALLGAGHLNLLEHLHDSRFCISVEIIDAAGHPDIHHMMVKPSDTISDLSLFESRDRPRLYAHPVPTRESAPICLSEAQDLTFRDFGLVSGSTLIVDYRASRA